MSSWAGWNDTISCCASAAVALSGASGHSHNSLFLRRKVRNRICNYSTCVNRTDGLRYPACLSPKPTQMHGKSNARSRTIGIPTMTDELALLAACRQQPDDDVARLVYADWLDEQPDVRVKCP